MNIKTGNWFLHYFWIYESSRVCVTEGIPTLWIGDRLEYDKIKGSSLENNSQNKKIFKITIFPRKHDFVSSINYLEIFDF